MKVYVIRRDWGESLYIYATRDLAVAALEPELRANWTRIVDPNDDLEGWTGYGGTGWRVPHYTALGFEAWRARELESLIEEEDVISA